MSALTALFLCGAIIAMISIGVALGQGGTGRVTPANKKTPKKNSPGIKRPPSTSGTKPQSTRANSKTAASPTPLSSVTTPSGLVLVWIPPGASFMMGSENGRADEKPVHRVTFVVSEDASALARLDAPQAEADFQTARRDLQRTRNLWESNLASRPEYDAAQDRYIAAKARLDSLRTETGPYGFYIGKYEVTQAQWQAVMGNNPSHFKNCDNCPVESVSWNDVQDFLDKLNDRNEGFRYRLPTEAEWEFASRASTQVIDNATSLTRVAWYDKNSGGKTHPVGQLSPNQFQLHDMLGNVWEWCLDWYHETYNAAPTDGRAQLTKKGVDGFSSGARVLRGGSYQVDPFDLRPSSRYRYVPDHRYMGFGFRVVAVGQIR